MKRIFMVPMAALLAVNLSTAVADYACPDSNDIQCIYITGLSDNDGQRWFKVTVDGYSFPISCFGSIEQKARYTFLEIKKGDAKSGTFSGEVSICQSPDPSSCTPLAKGTFKFSCNAKNQTCSPSNIPIPVNPLEKNYHRCTPSA